MRGLEPLASTMSMLRSNQLSYTSTILPVITAIFLSGFNVRMLSCAVAVDSANCYSAQGRAIVAEYSFE